MLHDLRSALRGLLSKPSFTVLAIATLALGIGATTAAFSLLDALYFRPIPLRDPARIVHIRSTSDAHFGLLSFEEATRLRTASTALADIVAAGRRGVTLRQGDDARLLSIAYVSPTFFETLGVPLEVGRSLRTEDEASAAPLCIVNHHLWRERLGARSDVVGSQIQLNDTLFTVVGVTASGFLGLERTLRTDIFVLARQAHHVVAGLGAEVASPSARWFDVYGRLADGASLEDARVQATTIGQAWAAEDPRGAGGLAISGLHEAHRARVREGTVFLALVALVLVVACANLANLALARSEARRRELAVRAALGATAARIVRLLAAESLLLALGGTAAGLLLAYWLVQLFPTLIPPAALTFTLDLRFDTRLFAFAAMLLVSVAALVALAPAWRQRRVDVTSDLKLAGARARRDSGRFALRDAIVVGQVAVGVLAVAAASLLVRSLLYGKQLRPGFDTRKPVASFYLVPGLRGYDDDATWRLLEEARGRVAALPGVRRASYAIRLPAQGNEAGWASSFRIPGVPPPPGEDTFRIRYTMVGPEYFEVMGTRLQRGRSIDAGDRPDARPVAVVSQTMAERLWPNQDPLGKAIVMGRTEPVERVVVGVAEDIRIGSLYEPPEMYVYVPFAQHRQGFGLLLVEAVSRPASIMGAVRGVIRELDPSLPILDTGSFERHMAFVLFDERRDAWLALGAGLLTLLLGAVGLYSVVSLLAARRTREIGIRMALGARRDEVLRLVLGRGTRLALQGVVLGLAAGLAATRLLASRLHGVAANDPVSFALAAIVLFATAAAATTVPAWRAARVDPAIVMREE